VSTNQTTESTATTSSRWGGRRRRWCWTAALPVLCLALGACTSAPGATATPGASSSPVASSSPTATASDSAGPAGANALTVTITEADGQVSPNGQKLDAHVGQQVVLEVTSDRDDEIHAHTGGDGYELEVEARKPARGTFTLDSAGSFEVESHRLGKVVVILNAR
jgi:hypothetical protein